MRAALSTSLPATATVSYYISSFHLSDNLENKYYSFPHFMTENTEAHQWQEWDWGLPNAKTGAGHLKLQHHWHV